MRVAVLVAALIAAVGCGSGSGATGSEGPTSLSISYWPQGRSEGDVVKWTLRCSPAGGTLPKRAAACAKLAAMKSPFARPRKGLECTQQYLGPQQAQITGTFRGSRVSLPLGARDGCQISRARRLAFLVPGFGTSGPA